MTKIRAKHFLQKRESKQETAALDNSPKGYVDDLILPFMAVINRKDSLFETTSSCSGRIAVFASAIHVENNSSCGLLAGKKNGCWLLVSHDPIPSETQKLSLMFPLINLVPWTSLSDLSTLLGLQPVSWKFEPFILHVACPNVTLGQQFLQAVFEAGYRTSGLINGKKRTQIVIRDTLKLDAPIGFFNPESQTLYLIVDESYIFYLNDLCTQKFIQNKKKMQKLLQQVASVTGTRATF